jgi:hypothetical protein
MAGPGKLNEFDDDAVLDEDFDLFDCVFDDDLVLDFDLDLGFKLEGDGDFDLIIIWCSL